MNKVIERYSVNYKKNLKKKKIEYFDQIIIMNKVTNQIHWGRFDFV